MACLDQSQNLWYPTPTCITALITRCRVGAPEAQVLMAGAECFFRKVQGECLGGYVKAATKKLPKSSCNIESALWTCFLLICCWYIVDNSCLKHLETWSKCLIHIQRPILVKIWGLARPGEGLRHSHDHPVSSSLFQSFKDRLSADAELSVV